MLKYKGTVTIGDLFNSSTWDHVYIKLFGTEGTSERTSLSTGLFYLCSGSVLTFEVNCTESIGNLVQIELDKTRHFLVPQNPWLPAKVEVDSPEGEKYHFPIYHWFTNDDVLTFSEGTALTVLQLDNLPDCLRKSRKVELEKRNKEYSWSVYVEGIPHCMKTDATHPLPEEALFSNTKMVEFGLGGFKRTLELKVRRLENCTEQWTGIDAIRSVFSNKQTDISEHVQANWMRDSLFGYQFLNGINPTVIRRCSVLPKNFPVTDDQVFLPDGNSLTEEMKSGNIFLCDYKILDGLDANKINGKQQYLMAPLVLLHQTQSQLKPIAIQLKQVKSEEENPIFFSNGSEYDWSLAKMYVRSADFNYHQLDAHLLRTHLLAEVFSVSLLRNLPMVHPLYKLLVPHTRYTIQINVEARNKLISEDGIFKRFIASGGDAMDIFLKRATDSLTYTSLCICDDIEERGLEKVANFYYRDDGVKMWNIINKFVRGVLGYYYKNDSDVKKDPELQKWVEDIFEHGFLSNENSKIPKELKTVEELVKYVTMVIFTVSAQHSAVNTGQFDYGSWMPNAPLSIQQPPPTTRGASDRDSFMNSLPDVNATVNVLAALWLLSNQSSDFVPLGQYPEEHFSELIPCEHIKVFQAELGRLSTFIKDRNIDLKIPYTYLDPELLENSIAI